MGEPIVRGGTRAPHVLPGRVAWSDRPAPDMEGDEE